MLGVLRKLSLGIFLIIAAGSVLLFSDLKHRRKGSSTNPRIAMLIYASRPVLEETMDGIRFSMKQHGLVDGKNMELQIFNAENDMPTASTMASAIVGGDFDLAFSISTPCLQALASANRNGKVTHIFGAVTDPFGAGVGISREDPLDHPPYMAGIGTFQPVKEAFHIARDMCPAIKKVGVVWNPAEACSEACTRMAREVCKELDIDLLEATVDQSAGVLEAARSLVGRGADCLWIGGDNTVELAINSLIKAAREGKIPVFANAPSSADDGAIFGLGANYFEVGKITGDLGGKILNGLDPATVRIENVAPERLAVNEESFKGLRQQWTYLEKYRKVAIKLEDRKKTMSGELKWDNPSGKKWQITFVHYMESPPSEETEEGFRAELDALGLKEGVDYEIKIRSAQGDVATMVAIMDAVMGDEPDILATSSTPTLQAAVKRTRGLTIVFSCVASPVLAGAGESFEKHLPHITGISTMSDFEEMVTIIKKCMPACKRIGTLFAPTEVNSVYYKDHLDMAAKKNGVELITVGVSSPSEVPDAALALINKDIDVFCQISDNLNNSAFSGIVLAAEKSNMPLFCFSSTQARNSGAALSLARDYIQAGKDQGTMAVRIMMGESPKDIPFAHVSKKVLVINLKNAAKCNLNIPDALLKEADEVVGK